MSWGCSCRRSVTDLRQSVTAPNLQITRKGNEYRDEGTGQRFQERAKP